MKSSVAVSIVVFAILGTHAAWAGDNVWTSLGPDGGSISSLVIDPQNTSTVYAGTQGNGVLKSLDGGTSWNQASMGIPGTWVMALAIDPQNTSTLYGSVFGHGVFKSTNGGASWNAARAGLPTYDAIDGYWFVPILVIDPQHPDTVYAAIGDDAVTGGVYKTTDGGGTWTEMNSGFPSRSPGLYFTGFFVTSLALDPKDPNTIYAALDVSAQGIGRGVVFRSADGGASWTSTGASPPGFSRFDLGSTPLVIDPGKSNTLYAGTDSAGVWKSTDAGASWAEANSGLPDGFRRTLGLTLDPQNSSTLYAVMGAFYGPHHKGTLFKSIDAGSNWLEASSGLPQDDFDPQDDCSCYSTPVGLAIDPGNPATVYVGTYGAGIFKTVDESAHWDPINAGLRAISGSLAIDPQDPRRLYLASRTRIYESSDGGTNWSAGAWGLPGVPLIGLVIDPRTSSTMYAWTGALEDGRFGRLLKTVNSGMSWQYADSPGVADVPGLKARPNPHNVNTLVFDPHDSATIYAGTSGGMHKTNDGGTTWAEAGPFTPSTFGGSFPSPVDSIAIDPQNPDTIYVGGFRLRSGPFTGLIYGVYKTTDGGASWSELSELSSALPNCCDVGVLAIDPQNTDTLYAGTGAGIFKSTNGGANWRQLRSGLPENTSVNSIVISPEDSRTLYVGTASGAFRSTDIGENWSALNSGLPGGLTTVVIEPKNPNTLYTTTNGGVFVITFTP